MEPKRMRYKPSPLMIVIGLFALAACGLVQQSQPESSANPLAPVTNDLVVVDGKANLELASALQPVQERIVLKNASITLTVKDATETINQFTHMAETMGGWVVSSDTSKVITSSGDVTQGTITIRVPAAKFDDALSQMKEGVLSVESESVTGQDVTQEYTDLTSQLSNLRAAETQLQKIMENSNTTEDVLSVYNELVRVRGEIETTQGRIRFYDESAAYSSINANLIPQAVDTPIQIAGWNPGRTAESALAALVNILRFAVDVLVTIIILVLPLLLILGIPTWYVYKILKRYGIIHPSTQSEPNVPSEQP